jgi:hypothetical protein
MALGGAVPTALPGQTAIGGQSQAQGVQAAPAGHSGQLQTQALGDLTKQLPVGQGWPTTQGARIAAQPQSSAVSARHEASSVWAAHGS